MRIKCRLAEAYTHCWRCGCEKNLQRCHIDGPNVTDPEIMWDWIKAYSVPFYDTFWGILGAKEYRFIYKKSFTQEIFDILEKHKFRMMIV